MKQQKKLFLHSSNFTQLYRDRANTTALFQDSHENNQTTTFLDSFKSHQLYITMYII